MPEVAVVPILREAKEERDLSIEDLRDAFYVSYEMAAHRFTNLATQHLGLAGPLRPVRRAGDHLEGLREQRRAVSHELGRRHRGTAAVSGVGHPPGVPLGGQVLDALPIHRHVRRNVLVLHPRRSDARAAERHHGRCRVRGRPVLPGHARPIAIRCRPVPIRHAVATRPKSWRHDGRAGPGHRCGPTAMCSRRCRSRRSPVST